MARVHVVNDHPDLSFATLGPEVVGDPGGARSAEVRGFGEAVSRSFLQGRGSDERHRRWLEHLRADAVTFRAAWVDAPTIAQSSIPVATFASWDASLNVGGGRVLPAHLISDVTVSPTHRRRGLTRRLMSEDLADAVARGVPLAALTVSEGSIYGRFGFGAATSIRSMRVDTGARFALREDVRAALGPDPGRFEVVEPVEAWSAVAEVTAASHAAVRGSVKRPQFYETALTGAFDFSTNAPNTKLRALVHLDGQDRPDGYALYTPAGEVDGVETVDLDDVGATSEATWLRLWELLASMDLVGALRWHRGRVVEPLEAALVEPRVVQTTALRDLLWVRVLDVVAALEARPWYADGSVVLEVDDPLGHAAGRWQVDVVGGAATVRATEGGADVRLGADTLGALYLGGTGVGALTAALRVTGSPAALDRLTAMADGGPAPWCATAF